MRNPNWVIVREDSHTRGMTVVDLKGGGSDAGL
jgi:hypothetical protein